MRDFLKQWHPAFSAAIHIELKEEIQYLHIEEEHLLGKKPMQIDLLIIKKPKNVSIRKNIGQIFREHNIIEYKDPGDSLSVNDFYKVFGYACFYQSDTEKILEINPREITITFACYHYPRKLARHLQDVWGMQIRKAEEGIYYLEGTVFSIQLLLIGELSKEKNFWLQNLRDDLKSGGEIKELMEQYKMNKESKLYQDFMNLVVRANQQEMEEEAVMIDALRELFGDELTKAEAEASRRGMERGMQQGIQLAKGILQMARQGAKTEEIAAKYRISEQEVLELLN